MGCSSSKIPNTLSGAYLNFGSDSKKNQYLILNVIGKVKCSSRVSLTSLPYYHRIQGSFGPVLSVASVNSSESFALKEIDKITVASVNEGLLLLQTELKCLSRLSHPFVTKIFYAFQVQTTILAQTHLLF